LELKETGRIIISTGMPLQKGRRNLLKEMMGMDGSLAFGKLLTF